MPEETQGGSAGKNVGMAVLSYFGILVLIPLLTEAKTDPFVKFHVKQGLVLLITAVIVNIIFVIPVIGWIVGALAWLLVVICFIMGIINAVGGVEKELPVIGKYGNSFNI